LHEQQLVQRQIVQIVDRFATTFAVKRWAARRWRHVLRVLSHTGDAVCAPVLQVAQSRRGFNLCGAIAGWHIVTWWGCEKGRSDAMSRCSITSESVAAMA